MGELVGPGTWRVQGRTITLPVRITEAEAALAVFAAPPAGAATCLAGTGLRPVTLAGRAFGVLMVVRYGEWALGAYDEVGVGLLAGGPDGRPGLHLVDLPVTGELTREAGQDIWGLPKWLMRADLVFDGPAASVTVHDGDTFVLRADLRAGRVGVPFRLRAGLRVWSRADRGAQAGVLLSGVAPMSVRGTHVGRGSARLELGDHPMARRMAALGMTGRPLLTVRTRRLGGRLGAFDPVG